ncbi:MAG TPA: hypothetical protein VNZ52_07475 [Candidatus Thermoplasmatota archaeon]|nr:hypothetical protein [Candidatus Thermoplasmatota archaeon]
MTARWREAATAAAPYGLLVATALAITWPLFAAPGLPYNVDISGFFPLSPEAYEDRFWPLWNERGGISTLQFLPALLFELPLLLVGRLLSWDMAMHVKVRILLGFALAGCGLYALLRHYLAEHPRATALAPWVVAALPLAPALFYMVNPWSVHRVFHYFLWLGYALAPFVLLAFERLAARPSLARAAGFAAVFALATTDPHNPPNLLLLLAPLGLLRFVQAWRRSRAEAGRLAGLTGVAAGAYLLLGAYWILPYAYNAVTNPSFGPTYVMSTEMLHTLSRNGDFLSAMRLMHNYLPRAALAPEGGTALLLWEVASYAVPLLALNALLLRRTATTYLFAAVGAASLALGMGDTAPFTALYQWLLFGAPWGESLSWLFRDPYRWGGFQALAYAVLAGFTLHEAALAAARLPRLVGRLLPLAGPAGAVACVLLFAGPALGGYVGTVFAPVVVPEEYGAANAHLATLPEDTHVVWMPRMLGATTWGGGRTLAYFDATSSARSALGPFRPHTSTYFNFLGDATEDAGPIPPLLARAGLEYVVFHNDRNPERDARTLHALEDAGLERVQTFGTTRAPVVDASSVSPAGTPGAKYALHDTRALAQTFVPLEQNLTRLTLKAARVGEPGPLQVEILNATGTLLAARNLTLAPGATEAQVDLVGLQVEAGTPHLLRLTAPSPASDAANRYDVVYAKAGDHRYDVSYYKADVYAPGTLAVANDGKTWKPLAGDVYFELRARASGFITLLKNPDPVARFTASATTVASPDGLDLLSRLAVLPNGSLRDAPVVFTSADAASRAAFARDARAWHWVTGFEESPHEAAVPFLPPESFIAPFKATVSADGKAGWARGTREFTYYEWGWPHSLRALKQESWAFDGNDGLAYTSAPGATLVLPVPEAAEARTVLARVYLHPQGGSLSVLAGDSPEAPVLGVVNTTAGAPGFRWVTVGTLPAAAPALTLRNDGGFQGVNLLAVATPGSLAEAHARASERLTEGSLTLLAEAERHFPAGAVAVPGVGRAARIANATNLPFSMPVAVSADLWLRVATPGLLPTVTLDGAVTREALCAADCNGTAPWYRLPLGNLSEGAHTLTLAQPNGTKSPPLLDLLALTTDRAALGTGRPEAPGATWERVRATGYRVHVNATGPMVLTFSEPYDAGWVAQLQDGRTVRATLANGVITGFLLDLDGPTTLTVRYAPQEWAETGAWITAAALLALPLLPLLPRGVAAALSRLRSRRERNPLVPTETPDSTEVP